jgi:hypothetical protein
MVVLISGAFVLLGGLHFQQVVVQTIEAFFPEATKRL